MAPDSRKTLMRSFGEFLGEIWKGVRHDPSAPTTHTLRHETQEQTRDTPAGRVTLRRTVVEEMRIEPPPPTVKEQAP